MEVVEEVWRWRWCRCGGGVDVEVVVGHSSILYLPKRANQMIIKHVSLVEKASEMLA